LRTVKIRLDGSQTVVSGPYLEPVRRRGRLLRGPAALLCDTAARLVRIDREMWRYPTLQRAYHAGELSPLVADMLVRVLRHIEPDDEIQQAWIDFAGAVTFEHLMRVVRAAERLRAEQRLGHRRRLGSPAQVGAQLAAGAAVSPMFGSGSGAAAARSPMFLASR